MDLASRLADVDARITDAAHAAGRDASSLTRIVVTKFHPTDLIRDLHALGVRDVGENRLQELAGKVDAAHDLDGLRWHFIGQAQTNKVRLLAEVAARVPLTVHSLDRPRLVGALDRALHDADGRPPAVPVDVLLQINLTDDAGRGGVAPAELEQLAELAAAAASLRVRGVMAVAPLDEEAAPAFARLAGYAERVRAVVPDATWISAGMTGDFVEAIAAGATHLRIGSAITGPRPVHD
ncbi:MAG TPA: YggS family pyridoxal phosphate-dependent enzyme [Microbacterium sp.]|uniref:YggS family pyridoxal phosphate-dependent enzyme n=1 Tax=Microbacterium sp. TaxID=51671 RepID=UPI002B49E196|nr:YggS family pyridoxal phosphate-dependent enzyme [Microbacterium sp.]HKT56548.1 YggS family pyridoxal phosphate-dependent enzyme [Microbacterium sp.]